MISGRLWDTVSQRSWFVDVWERRIGGRCVLINSGGGGLGVTFFIVRMGKGER